eukprot:SAG31_NODE_1721_length_7453_cov_35.338727_7_plen_96_part_01
MGLGYAPQVPVGVQSMAFRPRAPACAQARKELGSLCGRGVVEVTRTVSGFIFQINRSGVHSCDDSTSRISSHPSSLEAVTTTDVDATRVPEATLKP